MNKIIKLEDFHQIIFDRHEKVVHCHGVFDILHAGHLAYFKSAKSHGTKLIVTVTTDRYVAKGPGRPHFNENIRAQMLAALEIVDYVALSDYATAAKAITTIKPAFYVKGPDYRDHSKDVTGEIAVEAGLVGANGGQVIYTNDDTNSSSRLANKFFVNWSDEQQKTIAQIRDLGGLEKIEFYLNEIAKLKVVVIGEPILDVYNFCEPQNISSKSPSISAKFLYKEEYNGGSWAIVNHLKGFCDAELIMPPMGIPQKIRYISADKSQRMFEMTKIPGPIWEGDKAQLFINKANCSTWKDAFILADFGHGLFEGKVLEWCADLKPFVALNVQTNSSNYGFNPYHKHDRWDYLVLDKREIQMGFQNNKANPIDQASTLYCNRNPVALSLTLGSNGAAFLSLGKEHLCPAFADQVIDATGAGDAYFAITSLLVKIGAIPEFVPFIGNVFAGLKTKIIGNKSAVSKAQLLKACAGILK